SPIIMAPLPAGVNAAHAVSPANGFSSTPSTLTATSVRGHVIFTAPSGVVAGAATPAAAPIFAAFSAAAANRISSISTPLPQDESGAPDRMDEFCLALRVHF